VGDLNLKDIAEWLNKEQGLQIAVKLYEGYYSPLSHFFPHSSGFALIRHVRANGKLRHRPAFPWNGRSTVRTADGCTGLLAWAIADKTGVPAKGFLRYATAHLDRLLTPTFVVTAKGWTRAIGWRNLPGTLRTISAFARYVRTSGSKASPAEREEYIRKQFGNLLSAVVPDLPEAAIRPVIDDLVRKVLASMSASPDDSPLVGTQPDSGSETENGSDVGRAPGSPVDMNGQPHEDSV
jgi:hypothetical protein